MGQALLAPSRQLIVGPRGFRKPARPVLDASASINRGLVGCWPFGHTAQDISPYANNGTPISAPPTGAGHHGGVAMSFNGSTQYISVPNSPWLAIASKITISLWVKPAALTSLASLIARWDEGGGNREWALSQSDASGNLRYDTSPDGIFNGANTVTTTNTPLSTTKWTHVVAVTGSVNNTIYTNGVQNVSAGVASTSLFTNSTPLTIARATQFGGASNYTNGNIDCVRIYNRILSVSEIVRLYAEPYAGIYEAGPRSRVGAAAAGGATRPVKMAGRWSGYAGSSGGFAG